MQLCDAFNVPVVSLCDTPGFMVGPEDEKMPLCGAFNAGHRCELICSRVCDLPAQRLWSGCSSHGDGRFHVPQFCIAWPTGEFGPMGLEGAVRLGYSKELGIGPEGSEKREALFTVPLSAMYESGKALNVAMYHEIDAVIDPRDTRKWITAAHHAARQKRRQG